MATSTEAKARERLKAIADGVSGLSAARNVLGVDDFGASTELFLDMVSGGPYLKVLPAKREETDIQAGTKKFSIVAHLYFGFANDADYDFTAIEDIFFPLVNALALASNWTSASVVSPTDVSTDGPELKTNHKPIIGMYTITLNFMGC